MNAFHGTPPGPAAGDTAPRTKRLRPDLGLAPETVAEIRKIRRAGMAPAGIAAQFGLDIETVERALLAMRTPRPAPPRSTINCTVEARAFIFGERRGEQPIHEVVDRLIGELIERRKGA